ncbi:MAG: DNA gyrase subunit A [Proteobacteria bacterium]|uniref:DNA topoisomerase (ATP-hydrolyzing) n=1 Tax=Candidatus Avisuccinivibrio stercorigallinarum TaxID=2840704 RepID=A0A9D9DEW4_9GAMM|nr:DNA gyrase subunit A [Candidatus Avisuccinivibrio stercorigallinarum]
MVDETKDPQEEVSTAAEEPQTASESAVMDNVTTVKLEDELKKSFIDYAMSVIVDRALPDVRDGLKPVHRRVLFDMYDLKIWSSGQTKKSARVVGDVIGRFHPHGDAAVYDTIVRMAQWFSMREPLVFGQGNFGNIDGDGPAAMRYTEVKMTKIAEAMLMDIDKETVDTYPNYDGNEQIPEVLPTRFPNLLVNGSSGIAVGMATNIPPHNLSEVIDGTLALLDNPNLTVDELMRYIPGPDFPTGGYIVGNAGIREAYATGRGRCIMRARTHTETDKSGRKTIYVDEIPYQESKSNIVKQIADLVREKKIEGIAEVNDLSDKTNLVRIAIDLKRDAYEEAVLNNLFDSTSLQTSFSFNMIALVNNRPRQLSLKEILSEFIAFRREVVTRRTVYLLRQDRRKAFIDEGLIVAKANINRVIELITNAENPEDAKQKLMAEPWEGAMIAALIARDDSGNNLCLPSGIDPACGLHEGKYFLSEMQAKAILALQLSRLTHLATEEIQADYQGLVVNIRGYLEILNNVERMKEVIREELTAVKAQFGSKRRTDFIVDYTRMSKADLIARQDVVITLSRQGYIKYQDLASYVSHNRGGKGVLAAKLKDEDNISKIVSANTHDTLLCFTSQGRCFATTVYDLPTSDNRSWRGRPIQNIFNIEEGEKITALLAISDFDDGHFVLMATAKGFVKKTALSAFKGLVKRQNDQGIKCGTLREGDELIGVELSSGDDDVFLFTSDNMALHLCEFYAKSSDADEADSEVEDPIDTEADTAEVSEGEEGKDRHAGSGIRPSGRTSGFIRGMKLRQDARVVSLIVVSEEDCANKLCLIATANGYGKKMKLSDFTLRNRGGQGMKAIGQAERNGATIGAVLVDENSDYMLITDQGQLIRSKVSTLPEASRYAGGVILMRPYEGESVIAVEAISEDAVEASNKAAQGRAADKKALEKLMAGEFDSAAAEAEDAENLGADEASSADNADLADAADANAEDASDGEEK